MASSPKSLRRFFWLKPISDHIPGKPQRLRYFRRFAIMNLKANRDKVWKLLSPQDRQKWGREAFDMKLIDRSGWAYRELSALLELKNTHGIRPESLKGSVMGAIGWPQFLPSSLVKFGADGNGDGRIDLYNAEDAIFSTANYFRGHGWCEAKFPSDKEAVIWDYNHSKAYVRIVLAIAEKIRGDASNRDYERLGEQAPPPRCHKPSLSRSDPPSTACSRSFGAGPCAS